MSIKHKFIFIILVSFVVIALVVTGCTAGISRGWAGGAVTADGKLIVASMNGKIIAIDPSNNAIIGNPVQLNVQLSGGLSCIPSCSSQSAGLVIYASPVVLNTTASGTLVYIAGTDGKLYAYTFNNNVWSAEPEWVYPRSGTMSGTIIGGMVIANDVVYFATSDGTIYALTDDLQKEWSYKINSKIWSAPVVDGNTLYIGCFNKTVYALNTADGTEKWEYKTDGSISATPVIYNNTVYIGDYDRCFYALDAANGNLVWKFPSDTAGSDKPQNFFWAKPVVLNGVIYAPCLDGNLYALDAANGNLVKKYVLGDSIVSSPVVIGNSIVVATSVASTNVKQQRGKVYIIDIIAGSHQELDLSPMEDINAPLFAQGSIVYIHTNRDNLYSIDTATKGSQLKLLFNLSAVK